MRKVLIPAVVALAAAAALAVHAVRSDARWQVLSETAINTNRLCSDGLRYTWASGETTEQPPDTRPVGQPRFIGPVNLFLQHAPAGTPNDDQDWFDTPLAGADIFTAGYAPVFNATSQVWYPYSHVGTIAFRHPLTPSTEAVRIDTQPNGESDATTAVEPARNCVLFGALDFHPGDAANVVDFSKDGRPHAAILSNSKFDATRVAPSSVLLGRTGTEASPIGSTTADRNGDGRPDLDLQFQRSETGIICSDTEVLLSAVAPGSGVRFYEADAIQTINCTP